MRGICHPKEHRKDQVGRQSEVGTITFWRSYLPDEDVSKNRENLSKECLQKRLTTDRAQTTLALTFLMNEGQLVYRSKTTFSITVNACVVLLLLSEY